MQCERRVLCFNRPQTSVTHAAYVVFLEYVLLSDEYHQTMNFLQTLSLIASHLNRVVTSFLPGLPFQVDNTTESGYGT